MTETTRICFENDVFVGRLRALINKFLYKLADEKSIRFGDAEQKLEQCLKTSEVSPYSFISQEEWDKAVKDCDWFDNKRHSYYTAEELLTMNALLLFYRHKQEFLVLDAESMLKIWTEAAKQSSAGPWTLSPADGTALEDGRTAAKDIIMALADALGEKEATGLRKFQGAFSLRKFQFMSFLWAFDTEGLVKAADEALEAHNVLKNMELDV